MDSWTSFMRIISLDNLLATFVVVAVLKFLPIIFTIDFLDPIQNTIQDFNTSDVVCSQFRENDKVKTDTNVVLVNIGDLNRAQLAAEIEILNQYCPKTIGIDTFFRKLKPDNPAGDSALANAFSKVKSLVLVSKMEYNKEKEQFVSLTKTHPFFSQYASSGFANLPIGEDEFRTARTFYTKENIKGHTEYYIGIKLAYLYDSLKAKSFIERNNVTEIINFRRNITNGTYLAIDPSEIFEHSPKLEKIRGKIVLIGYLGPDLKTLCTEDVFYTPMNHNYLGKTYPDMYGVVVHANAISMILNKDYINTIPDWFKLTLTFIIIFLNMALFDSIKHRFLFVYETASVFIIAGELISMFAIMMFVFYNFDFEVGLREATIFGILMSATGFEIYHGSLKPLVINTWEKYRVKPVK